MPVAAALSTTRDQEGTGGGKWGYDKAISTTPEKRLTEVVVNILQVS